MSTRVLGIAGVVLATVLGWRAAPDETNGTTSAVAPLIGITVPSKSATVAAEQAGLLVSLPLQEGDAVERDQVLFKLNATLQELEVARLRPLADSNLAKLRAEASLAHELLQERRLRDLRDQNIASDADLQAQEYEVTLARLRLQQAILEEDQAKNQLAQAIEKLEQRSVKSPFAGIVTQRMKSEGESVERFVPVLEIMTFDPLWIEFDCPMHMAKDFRDGTRLVVWPSFDPDQQRDATVIYGSLKAAAASHTFMVRAAVQNPDLSWRAGQKMMIRLSTESSTDEITPKPGK